MGSLNFKSGQDTDVLRPLALLYVYVCLHYLTMDEIDVSNPTHAVSSA